MEHTIGLEGLDDVVLGGEGGEQEGFCEGYRFDEASQMLELSGALIVEGLPSEKHYAARRDYIHEFPQHPPLILFELLIADILFFEPNKQHRYPPNIHPINLTICSEKFHQLRTNITICHLKKVYDAVIVVFHVAAVVDWVAGTWELVELDADFLVNAGRGTELHEDFAEV